MQIGFQAPPREWSIYFIFEEVATRLRDAGHSVDLFQSRELSPRLREYDRALVHFQDFDGFHSTLWDEIKDSTYVWSSGINYSNVPWDRIPNPIAQSEWLAEQMPGDPPVCQAGVDIRKFYPEPGTSDHTVGTVGNSNQDFRNFDILEQTFEDYYHHDGWNDEFLSVADLRALYNSFDVYCSFSDFEGGGMTLLEAAACGCGVVSSPTGYAPNLDGAKVVSSPDDLPQAVERAGPFVDEILFEWSWDALFPKWEAEIIDG